MKKIILRKLQLKLETIRELTTSNLINAQGGVIVSPKPCPNPTEAGNQCTGSDDCGG